MARQRTVDGQPVVEGEPDRDLPALAARARVDRDVELERRNEMRREAQQPFALVQRLAHEADLEVLEVAQAAMDQARRRARGSHREIAALDEQHGEPAQRGFARDRGAVDAGADHDHVVERALGAP